jgi:hypothetical protein
MHDTLEDFYLAEALEYIAAWKQATADNPIGICGPIGPTEQLPLVARLVNELGLSLKHAHFWGMDEWYDPTTKKAVTVKHRSRSSAPTASSASIASRRNSRCPKPTCTSRPRISPVTLRPGTPACVAP